MMKKLLPLFIGILLFGSINPTYAQLTDTLFFDTFDTIPWRMYNTSDSIGHWWRDSVITKNSSRYSASDTAKLGETSYIESPSFDINGYISIAVAFDQICYIERFDKARLEYSVDRGPWTRTTQAQYTGPSFINTDGSFSKLAQAVIWRLTDTAFVFSSSTNAWVLEGFQLTNILTGTEDSLRIRFSYEDHPASNPGRVGTHQWWIDNVVVRGAPCELNPPTIDLAKPFNYIDEYKGRVYYTGPYDFTAKILDQSLIDSAYIEYRVKSANGTVFDSIISFANLGGGNFYAEIPSQAIGDTVCWRIGAIDSSDCKNAIVQPGVGFEQFTVRGNIPAACQSAPISIFPYYEDFNGNDFQVGASGVLANDWINATGDFHDWYVGSGTTPTFGTGPTTDIPGGGKYLFLEATDHIGDIAALLTPCVDLYEQPSSLVRFYLNLNTTGVDSVHIDIFHPDTLTYGLWQNDIIQPIGGNRGDNWFPIEFNTYQYRNRVTMFRIRGVIDHTSDLSDIALDSFKIVYGPLNDVRVNSVDISPFSPIGYKDTVAAYISNIGVFNADTFDVNYEIVNIDEEADTVLGLYTSGQFNWRGSLPSGVEKLIKFPISYTVPRGKFQVKVWVTRAGDEVPANDTSYVNSFGLFQTTLPFEDRFDSDTTFHPVPKYGTNNNKWEHGIPNFGTTNNAYSDTNCWDLNLSSNYYPNGTFSYLYTPFFDLSNNENVTINFYTNRNVSVGQDGVFLQYSIDRGATWDTVKSSHDTKKKNWTNDFLAGPNVGGTPVFTGNTTVGFFGATREGWLESEVIIDTVVNHQEFVLFRYVFYTEQDDFGGVGFSLDNFGAYDPPAYDAKMKRIVLPKDYHCYYDQDESITITGQNFGDSIISNIPVTFEVTHVPTGTFQTATEVIPLTLVPKDSFVYVSTNKFDFLADGDYDVTAYFDYPTDGDRGNDTLYKLVENIDGCDFVLELAVDGKFHDQTAHDSSYWVFNYTSGGRDYYFTKNYSPYMPGDVIKETVCIKSDSRVEFFLGDVDTNISTYSIYAFKGERDTVFAENLLGGPDANLFKFKYDCAPDWSAQMLDIIIDKKAKVFPYARDYFFQLLFRNGGLDSLDSVELNFQIDNDAVVSKVVDLTPRYPDGLTYTKRWKENFGYHYLSPGLHKFTAWTSLVGGLVDEVPLDDTLIEYFTVLDTVNASYCENFDDPDRIDWANANPYNYVQTFSSFTLGTPNKVNLDTSYSGLNSWVTHLDTMYKNLDSSSVMSPFVLFEKDSCYKIGFQHFYSFDEKFHDGGHIQITTDTGSTWNTVEAVSDTLVENWFNADHIVSIPNNFQNSGWTGKASGWQYSQNVLGFNEDTYGVFRFRMESDGSVRGEGWAIDDFCIDKVNSSFCFTTGIFENELNISKLRLGQNIPNPATNSTAIPFYLPKSGNVSIVVSDMLGKVIYSKSKNLPSGEHLEDINLDSFTDGIYYYTLLFENQKLSNKMIIIK